jgi:hypothetical protein
MIRTVAAFLLALVSALAAAQGTTQPPVRIRGAVQNLAANVLIVQARGGDSVAVTLADNYTVAGIARADLEEITRGTYIGTTSLGERDGALVALEIHIFPDSMRGTGEGHRDWDLRPSSKMTNASVADIAAVGSDRVMTVRYAGGEQKVLVPPDAVIVKFAPAERSEIKPGAHVFVTAQRNPDGGFVAQRVTVGLNGQVPPM